MAMQNRRMGWVFTGVFVGAMAMYFLDEQRGARRRAYARDKLFHWRRLSLMFVDKKTRDWGNRIYGSYIEVMNRFRAEDQSVDDDILIARIRSKVGRVLSHPRMVEIESRNGHVVLSGHVLKREVPAMYALVRSVRGVRNVENRVQPVAGEKEMSRAAGIISRSDRPELST